MNKITKISNKGGEFIAWNETKGKFEPKPYRDPGGVVTIGYGTTVYFDTKKPVRMTDPEINPAEGMRLLLGHANNISAPMVDKLCRDDLDSFEFDAVSDFVYNCGTGYKDKFGKFQLYKLFAMVNANLPESALRPYWEKLAITQKGKKLNGLITRRKAEADLYFKTLKR